MAQSRGDRLSEAGWGEVLHVNTYVVFVTYLSMAIKGLGFLMLTWTTVVLLGGFVDKLHPKDFWSLTFIGFIQAIRILDSELYIKLSYAEHSVWGLIMSIFAAFMDDDRDLSWASFIACLLAACILVIVQVLVFLAVLFSVGSIYRFGILICGGISLWRLIEHDYGDRGNDSKENLVPAMDALYFLAVLQCFLYYYRSVFRRMGQRIAKTVATGSSSATEQNSVTTYMVEMWFKCDKDLAFTEGTNLITKAVEKIGSNAPAQYLSGVETLYTAICIGERQLGEEDADESPELWGRGAC